MEQRGLMNPELVGCRINMRIYLLDLSSFGI